MPTVDLVLPHDIDDPRRPSGGNTWDRRVADGLRARGWTVPEHVVGGRWPEGGPEGWSRMAAVLADIPDGSIVLVDGLVGSATGDLLAAESSRLRVVLVLHQPGDGPVGCAAVRAAAAVVTTSAWTRDRVAGLDGLLAVVARPGVDRVAVVRGSSSGHRLLCVGAVTPVKGQDVLVEVLAGITERWHLTVVGSCEVDRGYAERVAARVGGLGLSDRVTFAGPQVGAALGSSYRRADLVVSASRAESYGMAIAEALAHGLPVVTTDVGGVGESLGRADDGTRPGALVPAGDPDALRHALHRWLVDEVLRARWRRAADSRRDGLAGWDRTTDVVADVLARVGDRELSR